MSLISVWVGGVTDSSAWVRAKVSGGSARLALDASSDFPHPTYLDSQVPTAQGMVSFRAGGLEPSLVYFYAVEVDGVLDTAQSGRFTTHPTVGEPASFSFGVSSCAGLEPLTPGVAGSLVPNRISNHTAFDVLRRSGLNDQWLFFAHLGDMHYYNPSSGQFVSGNDPALYRRCWDDVLLQPRQHQMYRDVPLVYAWDDHDFGPNDSNRSNPGRPSAQQVYREKVPSYPLPAEKNRISGNHPIYHSFQVGRVLVIVSDSRSDRSPDSDPENDDKTMLGAMQKRWMREVLSTSSAQFLVWLNPSPLVYGTYRNESVELTQMFTETGWINRMICVTGDAHHLGIDSGNGVANYPTFVISGIDSRTNTGSGIAYDIGSTDDQAGDTVRGLYGVIGVEDTGDRLTVTGTGYISGDTWESYSLTVTVDQDDDGATQPPRADIAVPVPRTDVTWLACNLISGRIITELPDITGGVKRVLGSYSSCSFSLPIPIAGPASLGDRAFQATSPGQTMIVPVVNDVPSAGFIVLKRKGGTGATLDLGCVSLEGYLNRRYVPSMSFTDADEADIARQLVESTNRLLGSGAVVGIGYEIDAPNTGTLRTREYKDSDDATVYRRLRELMGVEGGPEWTVDVDWEDDTQRSIAKIFRLRKRIGQVRDNATFDTRSSSEATYSYTEDYSDGRGANLVVATGSGEGDDRPEGSSSEAADEPPPPSGWPLYEQRISPSNSIKDVGVLTKHAEAELELVQFGSRTFELQTRWDATPRLNLDWELGDTVHWDVVGHRHPGGVTASGRVICWELDMTGGTVKPILFDKQEGLV